MYRSATERTKKHKKTKKRQREFFETQKTTRALVYSALYLLLRTLENRHREVCSSRLSGLSLGAFIVHKLYSEESDCVLAVYRPKLVTETGLVDRQ